MVTVHPFKSHHIKIIVIQGIVFFIQTVPLTDIVLHLTVAYILIQQKPIQATVLCPFPLLGKFLSHEQKFFARMAIEESIGSSQRRIFISFQPRHLIQKGTLAMNHLIM